jgi:hypothetical protein
LRENQEDRLKGILGIVRIAENPTTNAEDARAVACHNRGKRIGVLLRRECGEKVSIGYWVSGWPELADYPADGCGRHAWEVLASKFGIPASHPSEVIPLLFAHRRPKCCKKTRQAVHKCQ